MSDNKSGKNAILKKIKIIFIIPGSRKIVDALLHFYHYWLGHIRIQGRFFKGLIGYKRFFSEWKQLNRQSNNPALFKDTNPQLFDWLNKTPFDSHYLYQSAWAARKILKNRPANHVDVGSDLRFVTLISASVPTTFVDIRPPQIENLSGFTTREGTILELPWEDGSIKCLSCLHVVEHIGLGRYGDPVDSEGSEKACKELARVLAPGGKLYFSVPVGRERVCFNAHRIFDPCVVPEMFPGLLLEEFSGVDDKGRFHQGIDTAQLATARYGCGLYLLTKDENDSDE